MSKFTYLLIKFNVAQKRVGFVVKKIFTKCIHHRQFLFDGKEYFIFVFDNSCAGGDKKKANYDKEQIELAKKYPHSVADFLLWQDEHQYYAFVKPSPRQYLTYLQMQGKLHVMSCENNDFYDDCVGMFGFHIVMCDGIVNVKEEIEKLHFKNEIIFDFQSLDQRTRTLGGNGMMVGSKNSSTSSHNTTLPIDEIFTISHKRKKRDLLQIDEKFFENMDEKRRIKKRLFYGDDVDIVKLATDGLEKDLPTRNAEEYIASRSSFQNAKKKKINEVSQYPAAVANEYGGTSGGQADANAADGENDNDKQQQEQTTPNNGNIFVAMKSKLMNLFGDFL